MPTANALSDSILEVGFNEDVTWLVKRINWRELTSDGTWIDHLDIPVQFFRALTRVWPLSEGASFPISVVSHGFRGDGVARFVRRRAYIEWDLPGRSRGNDGADAALIVLAVRADLLSPYLWCWICDSLVEDEYAEAFFNICGEPSAVAYSRGLTMFPRILGRRE